MAAARRGRHRGRRVGVTLLTLVLLVCAGAGLYTWQVTAALRDAEQAIVVPLPSEPTGSTVAASTPAAPATPVAAASPAAPPTATAGSQLGLIGAVAGAATDGGDPGRDPIWQGRRYLNVLVLGFDSRDDDSGPPRSDVMLVAQLDLYAKTVNILSLPRDLWVTIPGHGEERVNAAYPFGWQAGQPAAGVALAKRTIEANFGIPIDYYISIDFRGFQKVVDAVGGIDVDVPYYIRDDAYPTADYGTKTVEFFPGPHHMDGQTALEYVRTRHQDTDFARRKRQEQVLLALFDKAKGINIAPRLPSLLRSFAGTVQTNFTFDEQLALGRVALAMQHDGIGLYSIDQTMTSDWTTPNGEEVLLGDWPTIKELVGRTFVLPQSTGDSP